MHLVFTTQPRTLCGKHQMRTQVSCTNHKHTLHFPLSLTRSLSFSLPLPRSLSVPNSLSLTNTLTQPHTHTHTGATTHVSYDFNVDIHSSILRILRYFFGGIFTHTHTHTHTHAHAHTHRGDNPYFLRFQCRHTLQDTLYISLFFGGGFHIDTHTHAHTHGGDNPCFLRFQCRHTCQHTLHFSFLFFEDCSLTHAHAQAGSTAHVSYDFNVGVHSGIN